ncbi:myb transcription factor [Naegleria gruberi]|uniref:Myb transcription factor n=1 Tax=Naegleria gruberi TaxID=5762 RepID=D2UXS3_NAEGR|nr:myb transcription factor [Naegleria gruberi]EFC50340.1 myb transcription factor [Naegleria gruberi]|eukprot:XP_002683084.1 myb transcription factor [Naegleria gruberi strain NEG-M]
MLSSDDSDEENTLKNALNSARELSNIKPNFGYSFDNISTFIPNFENGINNNHQIYNISQAIDSSDTTNLNISDRLLHLKEGLNFNEKYKQLLQSEIEKIEEAQRNVGTIQRDIRKELIQRQKGPPMSLYPSRKNLSQNNGKISKKLACEFFVNLAQSKLKASGSSAIIVDEYNTRILQSAAIASKGAEKPKKSKKQQKKKKRNTEDEEYISDSEFQSDDDGYDEEVDNEIDTIEEMAENTVIIQGPAPNSDTLTRQEFLKLVPLVFDTKKWSNNEIKNIRYAVRLQHQEMECKRVFETCKGDSNLLKKEFEKVKNMSGEELENIESSKIDWEKVAKFYVKTRKPEECRKFWEIELAKDIKKDNWSKEEDINLLYVADDSKGHDWSKISNKLYETQPLKRRPIHCFRRYQRSLNTNMMRSKWTEEEDRKLMEAVKSFGEKNWQQIANQLEERTGQQCLHRWMKTLNPAIKRGRWTVEEDKRLLMAVNAYPSNNWVLVNRHTPGRTDVQCRERWCNILNPVLNVGPWTKEEDESLKRAIKDLGAGNWSKIAEVMHPRTDNQCWRRWRLISSEEVSDYRKKIYKREKALVKNFVGREKERPDITADDLQITHPESDNNLIQLSISEFVEKDRSLIFSQNSLLSSTICVESMQSLHQSLTIPKLKSVLEIEWQRMDQIRFLLEKTPYFIGVPLSNILKRVMSLMFSLKGTLTIKHIYIPELPKKEIRIQTFKSMVVPIERPVFSFPCIVPTTLSPSLPSVTATSVSLNALATLQDVLYNRGSPKMATTTAKVIDIQSSSEKLSTFQIPAFQPTTKDWVYEPPTLVHNNASILHSPEFKTLSSVFNSLFQKPMQQTIGKLAERLPHLLRRVPHADILNKSMEESQTNYQHICQNSKDPFIIQQSKWETEKTLSDPPTFSTVFSLYHHLPTDDLFNRNEASTLPQAPLILVKPKGVRGRPKGSKNKKTLELERQRREADTQSTLSAGGSTAESQVVQQTNSAITNTTTAEVSQKRGRGRPKGSKNKPKTLEQLTEQKKKQLNKPVVRKVSKNQTGSSKKRKTGQTTDLTLDRTTAEEEQ